MLIARRALLKYRSTDTFIEETTTRPVVDRRMQTMKRTGGIISVSASMVRGSTRNSTVDAEDARNAEIRSAFMLPSRRRPFCTYAEDDAATSTPIRAPLLAFTRFATYIVAPNCPERCTEDGYARR